MSDLTITAVIPTRNRPQSLGRVLAALSAQERRPDDVIVVDASDRPPLRDALRTSYPTLNIRCLHTTPSLCAQRNLGIREATGSHVLLCDDDVEPPPGYLRMLAAFLGSDSVAGAVTGIWSEPDDRGRFTEGFSAPRFRHVFVRFVFQLTVWGDVDAVTVGRLTAPVHWALKRWYRARGNTWSLAGWPLVTQVRGAVVRTAVYSLGAALVRRDWLLASPYDEGLDAHGIGDHYGVALGFPQERGITVLTSVAVRHHRLAQNRLPPAVTYYRRVLALHYFMRRDRRFGRLNVAFLLWSLVGNALLAVWGGNAALIGTTLRASWRVASGRNPLLLAAAARIDAGPPDSPA